jgi:1-phosphatidylinositol phosphodiesterase
MGCLESSPYNQGSKSQMALYGNNSNWMGKYLPFLRDKKIIELTIPGSHDSGTYKTTGALKELALTQNISILQQLQLGIRYLDLRYAAKGSGRKDVWIFHGPFHSMKFENALREISDFLEKEPQEFIVIKCQREGDTDPDQYDYIVELFQTYFGKEW